MFSRLPVWAPSAVADPLFLEVPKAGSRAEIEEIVGIEELVRDDMRNGVSPLEGLARHGHI